MQVIGLFVNALNAIRHLGQLSYVGRIGCMAECVHGGGLILTRVINFHQAYKNGDLDALKTALGNPPDFPNCSGPIVCLEYAIYHSPLQFIRTLLELGADPNYLDHYGFPSLIAALSTKRSDKYKIIELLLSYGANTQQRGVNDYTPLHFAANDDDPEAIELLLSYGADATARTSVDNFATPLEEAEILGRLKAIQTLRR